MNSPRIIGPAECDRNRHAHWYGPISDGEGQSRQHKRRFTLAQPVNLFWFIAGLVIAAIIAGVS